jgi:hypothetical protein
LWGDELKPGCFRNNIVLNQYSGHFERFFEIKQGEGDRVGERKEKKSQRV